MMAACVTQSCCSNVAAKACNRWSGQQARSWPGGSGGPDPPPELLRVTFLNRVNPETFCGVGGRGG